MGILEDKDKMIERLKARIDVLEKELDAAKAERLAAYEKLALAERTIQNLRTDINDTRKMTAVKPTGQP